MIDNISKSIIQTTIDMQDNLIAIFKDEEIVMSNSAFNQFFGIKNSTQYSENFGPFINNFVPHPLYFHQDKIEDNQGCFEAISALSEKDKIVSMMSPSYDPHAFAIDVKTLEESYTVMSLEDISQSLIKRLMIDNGANIDVKTGAYTREYFTHISQSLEEAATFNEKNLSCTLVDYNTDELDNEIMMRVSNDLRESIRNEDMLIKWSSNEFILVYLVDNLNNIETFSQKILKVLSKKYSVKTFSINSVMKEDKETLVEMISRVHIGI